MKICDLKGYDSEVVTSLWQSCGLTRLRNNPLKDVQCGVEGELKSIQVVFVLWK